MRRRLSIWLAALAFAAVLPAAAQASAIVGTVTADSNPGVPIAGVEVCPTPQPYTFETTCAQTGADGRYRLELPAAEYHVYFSTQRNNLRYAGEFYNDRRYNWEADLFVLGASEVRELDAALTEGGSIAGTVTDEGTHQPIAGIWVCALDHAGIPDRCASSGADGSYVLNGLRSGEYSVEFEGGNNVDYLTEFYEDARTWAEATKVSVTAPATTSGIDAELAPGAQILGHVNEVGTGGPYAKVMVCAESTSTEYEACDYTDAAGDYAIRSLPAGKYLVGFGREFLPFGVRVAQWWQGASSEAEATPIEIAPPETRTGIDAQLVNPYPPAPPSEFFPEANPPAAPFPVVTTPHRCRRGFHRSRVRGKLRCVRKHRRHHRRHRNR